MAPPQSTPQQTRDVHPLLVHCWATVYDAGPSLNQQWANDSYLMRPFLDRSILVVAERLFETEIYLLVFEFIIGPGVIKYIHEKNCDFGPLW